MRAQDRGGAKPYWHPDPHGCHRDAAIVGDLDESHQAGLVRAAISTTRRSRWVEFPDDLYRVIVGRLAARGDRDRSAPLIAGTAADRLRRPIGRAYCDAAVPVGQRSRLVTAETCRHALIDSRELDPTDLAARARGGWDRTRTRLVAEPCSAQAAL